ncbi:AAA domain protein [compost metagenome]
MKIEKVIVEGFRAYKSKEDGTFDFLTDDGQCADFVAIYAPNGFGKSSFYDAVEWALTNNIARYLVASQRQNNNKTSIALNSSGEYQFILRNNQLGVNETSRVIVLTSDFHYINWVPKIKKGSRDYKFDPKDTFDGTEGFSDIFLSQDAIDGFIKEVRPEDRYKKFMQQFDVAEENYRSDLFTASNANSNKISQLKEQLAKLKEAINTPVDERIVQIVNSTIMNSTQLAQQLSLSERNLPQKTMPD